MDSRRLILIISLSFVLLLLWQAWVEDQRKLITENVTVDTLDRPADVPMAGPRDIPTTAGTINGDLPQAAPAEGTLPTTGLVTVRTDVLDLRIDPRGGVIVQADLLDYPIALDRPDTPVRLLMDGRGQRYVAQSGLQAVEAPAPDHYAQYRVESTEYVLQEGQQELLIPMVWEEDGIRVTKTFRLEASSYVVTVSHEVENRSEKAWIGSQYRQLQRTEHGGGMGLVYTYTGGVYAGDIPGTGDRLNYEKISFKEMAKAPLALDLSNGWVAMIQHYFLSAWVPDAEEINHFYSLTTRTTPTLFTLGMVSPSKVIEPGATDRFESTLYLGPKIQENLKPLAQGLELTVDFGMLTFIAKPIFWLLKVFYDFVGNWGWAIVMVTVVIKLIFWWPSAVSYRSMAKMRALTPKLKSLKERYAEDRQKLSQEMMKLYQKEKINPLGGCLPILIQIPVFIALYWVLVESVELRQAEWIFWIKDLSAIDPYFVLPILMGLSMWVQQKLNPAPMDPIQQKIFTWLPVVFTIFFAFFPAGLVLYWLVNNILSIGQQYLITSKIEREKQAKKA
ncbi:MAG TPA: membrane protein insertase YidC [Halothiobacillus sp.]|nr:membrane protein insertase YidC [Halothiobacillus sp.]